MSMDSANSLSSSDSLVSLYPLIPSLVLVWMVETPLLLQVVEELLILQICHLTPIAGDNKFFHLTFEE